MFVVLVCKRKLGTCVGLVVMTTTRVVSAWCVSRVQPLQLITGVGWWKGGGHIASFPIVRIDVFVCQVTVIRSLICFQRKKHTE